MTKLQDFFIRFEKSEATYAPGEIVRGAIVLRLSKSKNVQEIRLEVVGEAVVHWTRNSNVKDSSGRSHCRVDHYKGKEQYFSISNRLLGSTIEAGYTTLKAGHHAYRFSFQLPANIPCSIEHSLGAVRYSVRAVLDRPWRFDHRVASSFSVASPYDLNDEHRLLTGIDDRFDRKFCSCCLFSMGTLKVNVRSRVGGFVPGETIELVINYDLNSATVDLTKMKLKLQKRLQFFSSTPRRDERQCSEIVKKTKQRGPFGKRGETSMKMLVPALPASRLDHCTIINVGYDLLLTISLSGMQPSINRSYPVEVGTTPFYRKSTIVSPPDLATPYLPSAPLLSEISPSAR